MDIIAQTPKLLSTFDTAKLLGVDMATIIDWCQQGKLQAFKTPGGHRRINPNDLINFLRHYKMPIPPLLSQLASLKCLVVDDESDVRRVVTHVIKSIDPSAEVHQAIDGFEAGAKALEILPRLMVLDLGLPGVDGFNVCKHLRKDARFKQTKIIAITGHDSPEARKRVLEAGADDYLPKPFDSKELRERLLKLLGQ
ncbi:MAG: response regulator [Elusimicrobia bacterium]|nr:response regulator [Candidatus Obscuribacterium magneticum]